MRFAIALGFSAAERIREISEVEDTEKEGEDRG